jgi:hypothetical protein
MRSLNILKKGLLTAFGAAMLFTGASYVMAQDSPRDEWEEWQSALRELRNEEMEYRRHPTRDNYRGWQDALRDERREYAEYQTALARRGGRYNAGYNDGRVYNDGRYYNDGRTVVVNTNPYRSGMFRIYMNGQYANVDSRGYSVLREAVNRGYQQGYRAGVRDRRYGMYNYQRDSLYMSGTFGYSSYVARNQYQYYFQQGFQKGYEDGFYSRRRYGTGTSILGNVLNTILNVAATVDNDDDYR